MNKARNDNVVVFLKNITSAIRTGGWLMIGTGLTFTLADYMTKLPELAKAYGNGAMMVGGAFVAFGLLSSYFLRNKP